MVLTDSTTFCFAADTYIGAEQSPPQPAAPRRTLAYHEEPE